MRTLTSPQKSRQIVPKRSLDQRDSPFLDYINLAQFKEGSCYDLYKCLGSHPGVQNGVVGTYFTVWAPRAQKVAVMGDFNQWKAKTHFLSSSGEYSGIWSGFIPGVGHKDLYTYYITSKQHKKGIEKIDPFAFHFETPSGTSSVVWDLKYRWNDRTWMKSRKKNNFTKDPISIYEVHLGSWRRKGQDEHFQTYREMADTLVEYVKDMGFTHIEIMPVMEHPFYGSWGYQTLGFFAPTSRYGTPQDFMYLIDRCHQNGIGVFLDWVPSHFPADSHGLADFDGSKLFEDDDYHPDWKSCIFNLGRNGVKEFLISNALFWLDKYHVDGLRVDAVASMLYLDYSRKKGEWEPNLYGGRENLESIAFIRELNEVVKKQFPGVQMIAEESTAWPNVSRPVVQGGLGFDMKWNMGWMHDTLEYFSREPKKRGKHYGKLSFCLYYAFHENFILSLSHDEVVHEKSSLLGKMPGNDLEKFSNLRCLYGYMFGHPGKKLLFMGSEIAPWSEWNHDASLDWSLLQYDRHQGIQRWVKDLNALYKKETALHGQDFVSDGFQWLDIGSRENGVIVFLRKDSTNKEMMLVVCHLKNRTKANYCIGVPRGGLWKEVLNSDHKKYGGKGRENLKVKVAEPIPCHGGEYLNKETYRNDYSLKLKLPPLSVMFLKRVNV